MLAIGLIGAALITIISLSLYGKVYFYDGYDFTGWLWTICFILIGVGLVAFGITTPLLQKIISTANGRFILVGISYVIFFVIFALFGKGLWYFLITLLIMGGTAIYFAYLYIKDYKPNINLSEAEKFKIKAENKMFWSNVLAICLAIAIVITLLCSIPRGGNSSGSGSSSGSKTCGICGGEGVVTQKFLGEGSGVQIGFDTYYRCGSCHGRGTK